MATKYYGIKDNWTDDDVANVIEVASEDGSVSSVKVNGVEYGGGGGGDFSTAEVTVSTTNADISKYILPNINPYDDIMEISIEPDSEPYTWYAVLYKGASELHFDTAIPKTSITITGDANLPEFGTNTYVIEITGDCTITIS